MVLRRASYATPSAPPTSRLGLILLALLPVVTILGVSATGAAQPEIARGLGESTAATAWLLVAFILGLGVARPAMGRLTDLAGVRGLLLCGSVGLVAGSVGTLLSTSLFTMILARLVQGVSTSAVASAAFTAIAVQLAEPARSRAFGLLTAGSSLLLGTGVLFGALIVDALGWRASLASPVIAAPIGLIALRYVRETPVVGETLDATGAALLFVASACLLTLIQAESTELSLGVISALGVVTAAAGTALVRHTRAYPDGFIPVRAVRRGGLPWQLATAAALSAFAFGFIFAGPILLQGRQEDWSAVELGLALAPAGVVGALVAWLTGELVGRGAGAWLLALPGAVGAVSLALAGTAEGPVSIVIAMSAAIASFGLTQTVLNARMAQVVPAREVGVVLGLFSLVQLTGGSVGAAAAGALLDATRPGTATLLLGGFPVLALGFLAAVYVRRPGRR
jgi:MFS family permease